MRGFNNPEGSGIHCFGQVGSRSVGGRRQRRILQDRFIIRFACARPGACLVTTDLLADAASTDNFPAAAVADNAEPIHKNGQGKAEKNQHRSYESIG